MHLEKIFTENYTPNEIKEIENAIKYVIQLNKSNPNENFFPGHLIGTAKELAKFNLEKDVIVAGVLHETLTRNMTTYSVLKEKFGQKVANLVKECDEIYTVITGNINRVPIDVLNSIVLSISLDIQSLMIRIASILNVLENPKYSGQNELEKNLKAGKEIYLPLSVKLGMGEVERRLQDSIFKIESPEKYKKIDSLIKKTHKERLDLIENMKNEIKPLLTIIPNAQLFGRPKGYKSIFEKMKKINFKQIYDIYGIRIICNSEKECYEILGILHSKYKLIPSAFDDYISKPKNNGYKSIHTALIRNTDIFEVQIRTWKDHLKIESNLYWEYKSISKTSEYEKYLSWERQLVEWQKSIGKNISRRGITKKRIFVFTPKKEVIPLNENSTVIDFAYTIHTDLGNKLKKAKVNNEYVQLDTKLKNLDKVEVITDKKPQVKASWLNFVKSEKAKSKIKSFLGIKPIKKNKSLRKNNETLMKKIKMAHCCHPLPGEDVIGYKTTKRKIIVHKKDCNYIKNLDKNRLIEIEFEKDKGQTTLRVTGLDRAGLFGEILNEMRKNSISIVSTNFKIKNTGYFEAIFIIEIKNINKLEKLIENIATISSIHGIKRI
jgi:GTP diphosphokinase / guanosine-3',5'-bis(diphosphate) 3'-diphosphatase